MWSVVKTITKVAGAYALWGVVTRCDPHLVSDEAANSSKVLRFVRDASDGVFNGMKLCFAAPIVCVNSVKESLNKD